MYAVVCEYPVESGRFVCCLYPDLFGIEPSGSGEAHGTRPLAVVFNSEWEFLPEVSCQCWLMGEVCDWRSDVNCLQCFKLKFPEQLIIVVYRSWVLMFSSYRWCR